MLVMTPPQTKSKILLVAEPREGTGAAPTPIRRYRIARLRQDARLATGGSRNAAAKHAGA
jgi:hypothetical protein